jgi:hypothetical protein
MSSVGMALHGGDTLADEEDSVELEDFDYDDEEEAAAAGFFTRQQQQEEEQAVATPNTSGHNLLSMLNALP